MPWGMEISTTAALIEGAVLVCAGRYSFSSLALRSYKLRVTHSMANMGNVRAAY